MLYKRIWICISSIFDSTVVDSKILLENCALHGKSIKLTWLKALIFDFDGLILDTETPLFTAWSAIFREHGAELVLEEWAACLGADDEAFDAAEHLSKLTGKVINREIIYEDCNTRALREINQSEPLPGVVPLLEHARQANLAVGLASSSPRSWVEGHLQRLNLIHFFDCIVCKEDVVKVKPAPDLFLLALRRLGIAQNNTVIFEDSPNGITAAQRAGIFCVGVPNSLSRFLDISHADLIISSLSTLPSAQLLQYIQQERNKTNL